MSADHQRVLCYAFFYGQVTMITRLLGNGGYTTAEALRELRNADAALQRKLDALSVPQSTYST